MGDAEDLSTFLATVDALFQDVAAKAAATTDGDVEKALDAVWSLFERGHVRVIMSPDRDRIGIEQSGFNRTERRAMAKHNRRLIEARRRAKGTPF
jgi:hypothetical protein